MFFFSVIGAIQMRYDDDDMMKSISCAHVAKTELGARKSITRSLLMIR